MGFNSGFKGLKSAWSSYSAGSLQNILNLYPLGFREWGFLLSLPEDGDDLSPKCFQFYFKHG